MKTPLQNLHNKKGFTLIELLVVILLLAMLGVAALSSYTRSTETFKFLSNYQSVLSAIRSARSYAITNKSSSSIERYGVYISGGKVTVFADNGANAFKFDQTGTLADTTIENISFRPAFNSTQYSLVLARKAVNLGINLPICLFYESGSGELSAYKLVPGTITSYVLIPKTDLKQIELKFSNLALRLQRYIVISQISGLAEEFQELPT